MATIKKKDIKNYKQHCGDHIGNGEKQDEFIEELVDADGSEIEGDRNPTNDSEIEVPDQQTSDEFAQSAIQPNRYYYGMGGTAYSHGARVGMAEGEETEIDEGKETFKKMVEDILSKRNATSDMVDRYQDTDVNRNEVPDIEDLAKKFQKPIAAKRAQEILDSIKKNNLNGEEVGIILNYIVANLNTNEIPNDYKRVIKSKF